MLILCEWNIVLYIETAVLNRSWLQVLTYSLRLIL